MVGMVESERKFGGTLKSIVNRKPVPLDCNTLFGTKGLNLGPYPNL